MTEAAILFEGGGFRVTAEMLRTPRKTYRLSQVEFVSVRRSLLVFVGLPALGLLGFTVAFWRYLYPAETLMLVAGAALALAAASQVATLRVHSLALRDDDIATSYGRVGTLNAVRAAVEMAMAARAGAR